MSAKKKAAPGWTCTNPNCSLGMGFRIIGRRNLIGDGTWCVDCKGGSAPPPGHGDLRARGLPDPAADAWGRSQKRMKDRLAWEAQAKAALASLPEMHTRLTEARDLIRSAQLHLEAQGVNPLWRARAAAWLAGDEREVAP